MTYIHKAATDEAQRAKWRQQADAAAKHMKNVSDWGELTVFVPAFVFDDGVVKLKLDVAQIQKLNEQALADLIFYTVLDNLETDHRAAGESADAELRAAPGMECGHAAAQDDPGPTSSSRPVQPAAAAVFERCWRHFGPSFSEQCPNQATGGVQLLLYPHERFQKRYGRRPMLKLILDLPVCASCFAVMTPAEVIENGLQPGHWGVASKEAQRRNAGVLPIKENSLIAHVAFADPEYTALREHLAKHHPEISQPAPAGPQPEGAGHGQDRSIST